MANIWSYSLSGRTIRPQSQGADMRFICGQSKSDSQLLGAAVDLFGGSLGMVIMIFHDVFGHM